MRTILALGLLLLAPVVLAAEPMPAPKYRAFDSNGIPLAGGKLYSYQAGTTTPIATYTTRAGTVANANPVVLNANGEADVWLAPNTLYKLELRNSAGVVQWTVDNLPATPDLTSLNTFENGITVTQSDTNAPGASIVGNGTAPGVSVTGGATGRGGQFSGGSTSGEGIRATATGTSNAIVGLGAGASVGLAPSGLGGLFVAAGATAPATVGNTGVMAIGNDAGYGIYARAGASGSYGADIRGGTPSTTNASGGVGAQIIAGNGNGTGVGGVGLDVSAGTPIMDGSSSYRAEAITARNGDIRISSTPPASTFAMRNRLATTNIPKAWARIVTTGGGSAAATVAAGFNIASVSVAAATITVNLAEPFASTNYAPIVTPTNPGYACGAGVVSASSFTVVCYDIPAATNFNFQAGATRTVNVLLFGEQL